MVEQLAYTTDQVAKMLSISPDTVRELIHTKQLRAQSAGRKFVIPRWAVEDWLAKAGEDEQEA